MQENSHISFTIGSSVQTPDGAVTGFVIDIRGAAGGPSYIVKQRGHHAVAFEAEQLRKGPGAGTFERGYQILLHGSVGAVVGRDGSRYIVQLERRMRGHRFPTRFHLHGWEVALASLPPAGGAA